VTARDVLDGIKASSAGLSDLCAEHLRQSIRHVQRNCDIDCNTHEDTWDDCKQPDRGDGERMAAALASIPRMIAAVDAVLALHQPLEVFEYDHVNGVWRLDADGEKILMFTLCQSCTPASVTEGIGDCEYTEDEGGEVEYPCPTVAAIENALEGE
jgi:hypothetical protein